MEKDQALDILRKDGAAGWNELRRQDAKLPSFSGMIFDRYYLDGVNFSSCDLSYTEMASCSFKNSDFRDADLRGAKFDECNLSGADFFGADLTDARFDGCNLAHADLSDAETLDPTDVNSCTGLESANLPDYFYRDQDDDAVVPPDDLSTTGSSEEEQDFEGGRYVEIDGEQRRVPSIPRRVPAPIETTWIDDKLILAFGPNESTIAERSLEAAIESFRIELREFSVETRRTNIDIRIVERMERCAEEIPIQVDEFSAQIFRTWHQLRPTFEYSRIVENEQGSYIRARFLSLEGDLRGLLNSFPLWRQYEYESHRFRMPETFDLEQMNKAKSEIVSSLEKFPDNVDEPVVRSLELISPGSELSGGTYLRSYVYDFSAALANILSGLMKKLIAEITAGSSEGIREGTKKIVAAVMVGGGATMVWLIGKGLGLFPWLTQAWEFVKKILGL
jgi:hypothetical protein